MQPALTPVLAATPATPPGRDRVVAQRLAARAAVQASAARRAARLDGLLQDELGAPLVSNGWHWSLAHDRSLVCGVVDRAPVGIDLERVAPRGAELVAAAIDPREAELVAFDGMDWSAFTRVWTAKEAVLKAAGVGLLELSRCRLVEVRARDLLVLRHREEERLVRQVVFGEHVLSLTVGDAQRGVDWSGLLEGSLS